MENKVKNTFKNSDLINSFNMTVESDGFVCSRNINTMVENSTLFQRFAKRMEQRQKLEHHNLRSMVCEGTFDSFLESYNDSIILLLEKLQEFSHQISHDQFVMREYKEKIEDWEIKVAEYVCKSDLDLYEACCYFADKYDRESWECVWQEIFKKKKLSPEYWQRLKKRYNLF